MRQTFVTLLVLSCATVFTASAEEKSAAQRLAEQAAQFPETIIKITDGVYTAVGYSVSN